MRKAYLSLKFFGVEFAFIGALRCIQRHVFERLVTSSDDLETASKRKSLIEQSFRWFDPENKGHIDLYDLQSVKSGVPLSGYSENDAAPLSLSGFSDLLSEHMQNRYFPKGK